jgi:hypothetical protein
VRCFLSFASFSSPLLAPPIFLPPSFETDTSLNSPGNSDFLSMQLSTMQRLQAEQLSKQSLKSQKGTLQRAHGRSGSTGGVRGPRAAGGGGAGGRGALSTIQDS